MMNALIPAWIIGGPVLGLLILSFSFGSQTAMSGGRGGRSDEPDPAVGRPVAP